MTDAIVLLKDDHKTVEKLFKKFEGLGDAAWKSKRQVVDDIVKELSVHAAIEEQIFYPAVRKALPDLQGDVLEGLEEHHIVKWTLDELKDLDAQDERFDAKVTVLMESVRHHVKEEEGDLFPAVRKGLGRKVLQDLGAELEKQKTFAPKKPHPAAPDEPPANLLAGPGAAAVDAVVGGAKSRLLRRKK